MLVPKKSRVTAELHALIHALSPHEKRYFKLFAHFSGQKPGNNYILLFDGLNRFKTYDEPAIMAWVTATPFGTNLSPTVHFLMRLILRSLKLCHAEKTALSQAREQFESAQLLIKKGKYDLAKRFLTRARKRAEKLDAPHLLLEILETETQLLFKSATRQLDSSLEALEQAQQTQLALLSEKINLRLLRDRHWGVRRKNSTLRGPERVQRLQAIQQNPRLLSPELPKGFEAQLHYRSLRSRFALQAREYASAHAQARENIAHWEAHPLIIKEQPGRYIQYLSNYLNYCILALEKGEAQLTLTKIQQVEVGTHDEEIELLKQSLSTQLVYCLNAGNFSTGQEVVQEIERLLVLHEKKIPPGHQLNFYFNITTFHFYHGDFPQALQSLNRILNLPKSDIRQGLQAFSRIFQILLHYQLGNLELAEYLLRSAHHLHRKRKQLYPLEAEIFKVLRTLIFAPDLKSVQEALEASYQKLMELAVNPTGKEPAGTWEFIFWLQSILEHRPLRAVYIERVNDRWEQPLPG